MERALNSADGVRVLQEPEQHQLEEQPAVQVTAVDSATDAEVEEPHWRQEVLHSELGGLQRADLREDTSVGRAASAARARSSLHPG